MNIINTYNIFIDSSQRVSGTTSNFTIQLKKPLTLTKSSNYFICTVRDAQIPFNIQQVNSKNATLAFSITRGTTYNSSITLTYGNYNILNLLTALSTALTSQISTLISGFSPNLNFSYNQSYLNITLNITGSDNTATSITLNFSTNSSLGYMLGYTSNATFSYNSTNVSTNSTSTQNINVNPMNSILIRSSNLNQSQNWESLVEENVVSDILAKVVINSLPNTWLLLNNGNLKITLTNKIIDTIDFYLSSNLDYGISLNGLNWSCCISFDEIEVPVNEYSIHDPQNQNEKEVSRLLDEKERIINSLKKYKQKLISNDTLIAPFPRDVD
jgi:hypothetical protein